MLEQTLTIRLPEPLLHRVQRVAELTYRSVDEVLISALDATLRVPPGLPPALADKLAAMAIFTDEALLAATKSSLSSAEQHRLQQLTEASKTRTLTSAESAELDHLIERYDIAVLRRAHALALLAQRGYLLPERNDFSDDLPSATGDTQNMPNQLDEYVRIRADHRCEYCQASELKFNRPLALSSRAVWIRVNRHPPPQV